MSSNDRFARYLDGDDIGDVPDEFLQVREQMSAEALWLEPPAELQEVVVSEITAQRAPARAPARRWSLQRWAAVAGVAAAIVLAAVVVLPRTATEQRVLLQGTELAQTASAVATIRSTPSGDDIRIRVEGLPPAPEGFYYQAWVRDGDNAVTIGTFHMRGGGDDEVILWAGVDVDDFPVLTVTLEPDDGDPTSSGQVVLKGQLAPDDSDG